MWPLPSQDMLHAVHGNSVQVSDLQKVRCQHGAAVAQTRARHRSSADAGPTTRHQSDGTVQRLQPEELCALPLAGQQVCHVRQLQHERAAAPRTVLTGTNQPGPAA